MNQKSKGKKIIRGISKEFAEVFKKSELYRLYESHKNELIIGVRNDYLNLYYNCDSIAKINFTNSSISCEIDKYYLDGNHYKSGSKEKKYKIDQSTICRQYEKIKIHSNNKATLEKKAQSKLVILNNKNSASNWFCIDIEYVKAFNNAIEKAKANFSGRFDIIAISKEKPHKIALIELKYGSGAISGQSGIYKHVKDFIKFGEKGYFENHLRQEIIEIIKSQINLGINVPFNLPSLSDLLPPDFYFVTLDNNAKTQNASSPKQTMAGYLFKDKRWDCERLSKKYCVETDFGDITKKDNTFCATFLFSKATIENIEINDIIDGQYDERIIPK